MKPFRYRLTNYRLPIKTLSEDARRLMKMGGISFLIHLFIIFTLLLFYAGNGSGNGHTKKDSSYRVTIKPLSNYNRNDPPLTQKKRTVKKTTKKSPTPETPPQPEPEDTISEAPPDNTLNLETASDTQKEEGSGKGDGSGTGWNFFGIKGFGKSHVTPPRFIENPNPKYPKEARQKGYEGKVLLKVEVLNNGHVGQVEMEQSSGHVMLDQSALETMKRWRFIPAKRGRVPIRAWASILLTFQLRDGNF